jgi:hypothetical protein
MPWLVAAAALLLVLATTPAAMGFVPPTNGPTSATNCAEATTSLAAENIQSRVAWQVAYCGGYAFMESWNTAGVTDMNLLFDYGGNFAMPEILDLNGWDTSAVVSFRAMFLRQPHYNGPLNGWDTAQVTSLDETFREAVAFNQNIDSWSTASVTTMAGTFNDAAAFNQNLNSWNMAAVKDTTIMFGGASVFDGNITGWDVSAVTDTRDMFDGASAFNQNIAAWDVSAVSEMNGMFTDASAFNQDINPWDVSTAATNNGIGFMFKGATAFMTPITQWGFTDDFGDTFSDAQAYCPAGFYVSVFSGCLPCPPNTYMPTSDLTLNAAGYNTHILPACFPTRTCPSDEFQLLASSSTSNTACAANTGSHCDSATQFVEGTVSLVDPTEGVWALKCTLAAQFACPWANDPGAPDHTHIIDLHATYASDADRDAFAAFDAHFRNHMGDATYVEVCTSMQICAKADNEYASTPGTTTSDRICSECPRLCAGAVYADDPGCPDMQYVFAANAPAPFATCMVAESDNSPFCCRRGDYDRVLHYEPAMAAATCAADSGCSHHEATAATAIIPVPVPCHIGEYFDREGTFACAACPTGKYMPSSELSGSNPPEHLLEECFPAATVCPSDEFELLAATSTSNLICGARTGGHCDSDQYVVGYADEDKDGLWQLKCTAVTPATCPWTLDGPTATHTINPSYTSNNDIDVAAHGAFDAHFNAFPGDATYVPLCSAATVCVAADNMYARTPGTTSSNRVCSACPRLCAATGYKDHAACPDAVDAPVPYSTCTLAVADNAPYCCRRNDYNRSTEYEAGIATTDCTISAEGAATLDPLATCDVGAAAASPVPIPPDATTITTVTTLPDPCAAGEFYDLNDRVCTACPEGQYQGAVTQETNCRPMRTCPYDEIELMSESDSLTGRKLDTLCGSVAGCSHGEYRKEGHADHPMVGTWTVNCAHLAEMFPNEFVCAEENYVFTISYNQHAVPQYTVTAPPEHTTDLTLVEIASLQKLRECVPWSDCEANLNLHVLVEGTEYTNRVCAHCPVLHANCPADSGGGRAIAEDDECNQQPSAAGVWTSTVGRPECTSVDRDNQATCCRRGYNRATHYFETTEWDTTAANCSYDQFCSINADGTAGTLLAYPPAPAALTNTTSPTTNATTTTTATARRVEYIRARSTSRADNRRNIAAFWVGVGALAVAAVVIGLRGVAVRHRVRDAAALLVETTRRGHKFKAAKHTP